MWGLATLLLGVAYGWAFHRQDRSGLLVTSVMLGFLVGAAFHTLGGLHGLHLPGGLLGLALSALLLTVLFVVGVVIGNVMHGRPSKTHSRRNN